MLRLAATPTGTDGGWRLEAPFPGAPRWSPEDPHRLVLRLTLRGADRKPADVLEIPFGFRELWAEGPDFVFNGVKRHLLATSTWPATAPMTRDQVRDVLKQVKAANTIAIRFHTQPWREMWLEEADALGIMVVDEAALWCDGGGGYAYKDPRFWANYREHVAGMIRRDRNHASLVMWSLENELLHCGGAATDPGLEGKLADLGRFAKALDPSHLITFEADLDPGAAADVIGLHYPHELPDYADWPDTANWLGDETVTGTAGGLMGSRGAKFRWDRTKPLYIGEYLWVPDGTPAPGTVYYGDEAYADTGLFSRRAKARAWEDQAVAYRAAGVSGQCPWTMFESDTERFPLDLNPDANILCQAQAGAYVPVAAYLRECDTRFFRGEAVTRTFDVFNDSTAAAHLNLAWAVAPAGPNGSVTLFLEPGGRAVVPVLVVADSASSSTLAAFATVLTAETFRVHRTEQRWTLEPKRPLASPAGVRLRLYDPAGIWGPKLLAEGLKTRPLASLDEAAKLDPARDILVIAPSSLSSASPSGDSIPVVGRVVPGAQGLAAFFARGGRALFMEQDSYGGLLPGIALVNHASTMTFPAGPDPLLEGLAADDLKFWRPGHYVTRKEVRRPAGGGARTPVVSGGRDMLDQAPVVDLPVGPGRAILLQALCGAKLGTEPAARRLFQNALGVLATPARPSAPAVVFGGDAFTARLEGLGVRVSRVEATRRVGTTRGFSPDGEIPRVSGDAKTPPAPGAAVGRTAPGRARNPDRGSPKPGWRWGDRAPDRTPGSPRRGCA